MQAPVTPLTPQLAQRAIALAHETFDIEAAAVLGLKAFAVAIIGGTITSTILTLLIIPSFYDSIELTREAWARRFQALGKRFMF